LTNQIIYKKVLYPIHKHFWKRAKKKLSRKITALYSNLKKRSMAMDIKFDITRKELEKMFLDSYGKQCVYCTNILSIRTIACDHIIPMIKGGESTAINLRLVCKTCNTRKGPLDEEDFKRIIKWISRQSEEVKAYLLRKLAKGGKY